MKCWILYCPGCGAKLTHSLISDSDFSSCDPYTSLAKPKFPDGGLSLFCPKCNDTSLYQRYQLVYQNS
jgi:hypothetical protein